MNARVALQLVSRMHALLLLELNHGIEPSRMLADALYARDVLLVCDAYRGSELAALAQQFRTAMTQAEAARRQGMRQDAADGAWPPAEPDSLQARPDDPGLDGRDAAGPRGMRRTQDMPGTQPADTRPGRADPRGGRTDVQRAGSGAARVLHSLFGGPPAPRDKEPSRGLRSQRGWFGRWRDTGK